MRIVFVHRTIVDYTAETPYQRALGGTESGVAYLSVALSRLGHAVTILANPSTPGMYLGVESLSHRTALTADFLNGADAVVVVNEACGRMLREMGVVKPLVLWTGHLDQESSVAPLEFSRERKAWSGFAFVSQWQLNEYCQRFWLPREKAKVLRNAIAPIFAETEPGEAWFTRGTPPTLVYTSAPYRGLEILLDSFPSIRAAVPGTRLSVFAGLSATRGDDSDTQFAALHQRCLQTDGADYIGPVSQPALAKALSESAALAYPSTYPETSCIAVMEAMVAGAAIFTTGLGALPETLGGLGHMVPPDANPETLARKFAGMTIEVLNLMRNHPEQAAARQDAQRAYIRQHYQWPMRALEWQDWLSALKLGAPN